MRFDATLDATPPQVDATLDATPSVDATLDATPSEVGATFPVIFCVAFRQGEIDATLDATPPRKKRPTLAWLFLSLTLFSCGADK